MATYKVIQDIEAEDKLLGPLSFRQFVYFLIAAFFGYLNFIALAKGFWPALIVLGPPMAFCLFFAWPWTPDQPTEVWALARIRFLVKPRKRIWNQSGIKNLVTITVPKKVERNYTDGLSQTEVRSRLQALAHTIDSRGWAIKNSSYQSALVRPTDRLLDFSTIPQEVSNLDVRDSDDILDEANNPTARNLNQLINNSSQHRREELIKRLNTPAEAAPQQPQQQWFTNGTNTVLPPVHDSVAATDELQLPNARQARSNATKHLKQVQPVTEEQLRAEAAAAAQAQARQEAEAREAARAAAAAQQAVQQPAQNQTPPTSPLAEPAPAKPVASQPDPAILNLAHDNNLDVATIAREAKRVRDLEASDGEVSVSLH